MATDVRWKALTATIRSRRDFWALHAQSAHNLNKTASEVSMVINAEKTRVMAFRGMEPIRSKICINNKTLKQQNTLNYWGTTYPMKERKI
jgi:hypothetical protein